MAIIIPTETISRVCRARPRLMSENNLSSQWPNHDSVDVLLFNATEGKKN